MRPAWVGSVDVAIRLAGFNPRVLPYPTVSLAKVIYQAESHDDVR
jgi:hypothetical protein